MKGLGLAGRRAGCSGGGEKSADRFGSCQGLRAERAKGSNRDRDWGGREERAVGSPACALDRCISFPTPVRAPGNRQTETSSLLSP